VVNEHLRASRPGSLITSGGGSLGWAGGAAVGAKLAAPERTMVSLVGDGSYLFSVPSSVHWTARRYRAPSLTVILDNQGWKSPSLSTLAVHPVGELARGGFVASFRPEADLPGVAAAAGGAHARTVTDAAELPRGHQPGAGPGGRRPLGRAQRAPAAGLSSSPTPQRADQSPAITGTIYVW
jgi:acetolactate synthase-1/2/3 large subunit